MLYALLLNELSVDLKDGLVDDCLYWDEVMVSLLLYADDSCILAETPEGLQRGLDILHEFYDKWCREGRRYQRPRLFMLE